MAEHPEMTATANRSDRSAEHVIREAIITALRYTMACPTDDADAVLATRIPQACQTCGGEGEVTGRGMHDEQCPDCPTIGTLLLYGWNVAMAVAEGGQVRVPYGHLWLTAPNLLAALREMPT